MKNAGWIFLATALALAGAATASHDANTLPMTHEDDPLSDALDWLSDHVDEDGCATNGDGACSTYWTKWFTLAAAHAGHDPSQWPTPAKSTFGYLEANTNDLRDEDLKRCQDDPERECHEGSLRTFSLAKSILAFQASGHDATAVPLPDGNQRDLVAELLDNHHGDGFGDPDRANDDIWALIALNNAAYYGPEAHDAIQRIKDSQTIEGGVQHTPTSPQPADVDTTAAAIWALAPHDENAFLDDARTFLENHQEDRGERKACWDLRRGQLGDGANAHSTAWAIQALAALDEDPLAWNIDDNDPIHCLLAFQQSDGGFKTNHQSRTNHLATQQAAIALTWTPYGALTDPQQAYTEERTILTNQETTTTLPSGFLRIESTLHDSLTWTPQQEGTYTFHGTLQDPYPRPATLIIHAQDEDDGSTKQSSTSSSSSSTDSPTKAPTIHLPQAPTAERNVSTTLTINVTPDGAPIVETKIDYGDGNQTPWQASNTYTHTYTNLGDATLTAWAKDADGNTGHAQTTLTVTTATPRITLDAPTHANRTEPIHLHADATDPDGPLPEIHWETPNGTRHGEHVNLTLHEPGTHTITATATDDHGNQATASTNITTPNRPPTNLSVHPRTLPPNTTTVLTAHAHDPDKDPLRYVWTPPGHEEPTTWGAQHHLKTGSPGEITLTINATDPHGGWIHGTIPLQIQHDPPPDDEDPTSITTETSTITTPPAHDPRPNHPPPTVDLPPQRNATANTTTLLEGQAHAPNTTIQRVIVELGTPLPTHGTTRFTTMLPPLPPGTYNVTARAIDHTGQTSPPSNTTLTIHAPPTILPDPEPHALEPSPNPTPLDVLTLSLTVLVSALTLKGGRRA